MNLRLRHLLFAAVFLPGCASHRAALPTTAPASADSSTVAAATSDPKAFLSLDQIDPIPHLSEPATQPTTRPSVEALVLYGTARDAQAQGQRYSAISALEKAITVDPGSYDLYFDLGKAYLTVANVDDRSIAAFEKAAAISPDHLDVHIQLGRQYVTKGDPVDAIRHLRLALQTTEYDTDDGQAAVADFLLARALKDSGYDRAALDQYDVLLRQLKNPSLMIRQNPELQYLLDRPELMYVQIGELYEKHGSYGDALKAYEPAAVRDPDNIQLKVRIARTLASLGRADEALSMAADLVVRERASTDSLVGLGDVCRRLNRPEGEVEALGKLHHDRPQDRAVLFALCDILISKGRGTVAEQLLADTWLKTPGDVPIVRRLVAMYRQRGALDDAARVLVIALAKDPDSLRNLSPLWFNLLRPTGKSRLRIETVQAMQVADEVKPAREFWVSRLAEVDHRDVLAKSALQQSIAASSPFVPSYRAAMNQIWAQDELSDEQKSAAADRLITAANTAGNVSLAEELKGLALLAKKQSSAAAEAFAKAMDLGGKSPDLILSRALASRRPGRDPQFEQLMWKLISDHPLYEDGYAVLFRYFADADVSSLPEAMKVLSSWRTADPQSITARLVESNVQTQLNQTSDAEAELLQLFDEDPDQPEVLDGLRNFYTQSGRPNEYLNRLEGYREKHPTDVQVAGKLVGFYAEQNRAADANRVADAARAAVNSDPDLLYAVAQLYGRLDEKPLTEAVLQQVVQLDPSHAGASNDLGFSWADAGKNLSRAESLIRVAVSAEPDNQSFLDSLGWVLYKRGKFDEAGKYLQEAVGPAAFPDPIVLDHLGDTFYRLSRATEAAKAWQRSLKGIGDGEPDRDDLKKLRLQLRTKLKQTDAHQPVDVSPVAESASAAQAAK